MFRSSYAFSLRPKAVQSVSKRLRVGIHRSAPQGSNTRATIERVAHMKARRADWSFKPRKPYPVFRPEV